MSTDEIEAFLSLIGPLLPDWDEFEVRAIAQRGRTTPWVLNCTRVFLGPGEGFASTPQGLPRLEDLLVHCQRMEIKGLPGFLGALAEGDLVLGKELVDLRRPNTNPPNPSLYVRRLSRSEARSRFAIDYSCIVLSGGDSLRERLVRDELDTLDARLRASDPPWDGLADLRRTFVGIERESAARRDWSSLDIISPVGAHLSNHELAGTALSAHVKTRPSIESRQIVLSLVCEMADGSTERRRHAFGGGGLGDDLAALFQLSKPMIRGGLSLTYRGMEADRVEVYGSVEPSRSGRFAVMQEMVGGTDSLIQGLQEARGTRLEEWAALLFDALGFLVNRYGFLPETPDLIAFASTQRWFLVIECTSREPDLGGKLTKLATRTKELSGATGLPAYPVIVTGLDRALLNRTDLEKAEKERIAVVSASDFAAMVALALDGPDVLEVREYFERLIPREAGSYPSWPK